MSKPGYEIKYERTMHVDPETRKLETCFLCTRSKASRTWGDVFATHFVGGTALLLMCGMGFIYSSLLVQTWGPTAQRMSPIIWAAVYVGSLFGWLARDTYPE